MSDPKTFRESLDESRRFEREIEGVRFKLVDPLDGEMRAAYHAARNADGTYREPALWRAMLDVSVIGWEGLTQRHIRTDKPKEAIQFSPEWRAILLDYRLDIVDQLTVAVLEFRRDRTEKLEAARKKSATTSSST